MGLLNLIEEAAGTIVAVEGLEKVDPNAGLLAKGAAAFAGFKGAEILQEKLTEKPVEAETPPSGDDPQA
ncbi:MAG TPA: hypothetical protein VK832_09280 [Burkholderiaceae bacterium]|nr:hypothetical protein [Burkholderiaceae bacterium]